MLYAKRPCYAICYAPVFCYMLCACVLLYAMCPSCALCYVPVFCFMLCARVVLYAMRPCSTTLSNGKNQICVVLYAMRLYCTTSSPHVKNQICVILYACCTTALCGALRNAAILYI